jgi:hypothetical protein
MQAFQTVMTENQPKVDLDYIYNFDSIFANPEQEKLFVRPYDKDIPQDVENIMQKGPYDDIINPEGEEDEEDEEKEK